MKQLLMVLLLSETWVGWCLCLVGVTWWCCWYLGCSWAIYDRRWLGPDGRGRL